MPTTAIQSLPYPAPGDSVDVPRDVGALATKLDPLGYVPVGAIMLWPTAIAPLAWLLCNGVQYNDTDYPALAALLGSVAGKVTVPDYRNIFPVGAGTAALGTTGGTAQLPAHSHGISVNSGAAGSNHYHGFRTNTDGLHTHNFDSWYVAPFGGGVSWAPVAIALGSGVIVPYQGAAGTQINQTGSGGSGHFHDGVTANGSADHVHSVNGNTQSAGAGTANENRPPFRAVNFIIRAT